jgi:DNA mismatch repair protein MSH2
LIKSLINSLYDRFKLGDFDLSQYMKLDSAAAQALLLFPTATDSDKNMSLYGLLNKCKTQGGSRLLKQWVKQPLRSVDAINRRLSLVELLVDDLSLRSQLQVSSLSLGANNAHNHAYDSTLALTTYHPLSSHDQ